MIKINVVIEIKDLRVFVFFKFELFECKVLKIEKLKVLEEWIGKMCSYLKKMCIFVKRIFFFKFCNCRN